MKHRIRPKVAAFIPHHVQAQHKFKAHHKGFFVLLQMDVSFGLMLCLQTPQTNAMPATE